MIRRRWMLTMMTLTTLLISARHKQCAGRNSGSDLVTVCPHAGQGMCVYRSLYEEHQEFAAAAADLLMQC